MAINCSGHTGRATTPGHRWIPQRFPANNSTCSVSPQRRILASSSWRPTQRGCDVNVSSRLPSSAALDLGIVVPLYNKESTITRAIESLLSQTERPRRIVVVDDGSTDGSLGAIAPYRDEITILKQSNAGPGAARNRGVQELDTEWVGFA